MIVQICKDRHPDYEYFYISASSGPEGEPVQVDESFVGRYARVVKEFRQLQKELMELRENPVETLYFIKDIASEHGLFSSHMAHILKECNLNTVRKKVRKKQAERYLLPDEYRIVQEYFRKKERPEPEEIELSKEEYYGSAAKLRLT